MSFLPKTTEERVALKRALLVSLFFVIYNFAAGKRSRKESKKALFSLTNEAGPRKSDAMSAPIR